MCRLSSINDHVNNRGGDIYKEAMQPMHIRKQFDSTTGWSELLRIAAYGGRVEVTLFRVNPYAVHG